MGEFNSTREVNTDFWSKANEYSMTFEERLIYLYTLTNKNSCKPYFVDDVGYIIRYKFSVYLAAKETGFSEQTVISILKRMTETLGIIEFNEETHEIEVFPM